jgi:hypothetical protein
MYVLSLKDNREFVLIIQDSMKIYIGINCVLRMYSLNNLYCIIIKYIS